MRFAWLVARRYLRSPYKPAVLRLVTLFSVIGIGAGVATLVIALSMNTGFRRTIHRSLPRHSFARSEVYLRPEAQHNRGLGKSQRGRNHLQVRRDVAPRRYAHIVE